MRFFMFPDVPIDFGPSYEPSANVNVAQFGDGYMQAGPAGINNLRDSYSISHTLLTRDEFDLMDGFFRFHRRSMQSFLWAPPWEDEQRLWYCSSYSGNKPTSARFASIQASLVEDFRPRPAANPEPWLGLDVKPLLYHGIRY